MEKLIEVKYLNKEIFDIAKFKRLEPVIDELSKKFDVKDKKQLFEVLNSTTKYSIMTEDKEKRLIFVGALHVKKRNESRWFLDVLDHVVLSEDPEIILVERACDLSEEKLKIKDMSEIERAAILAKKLNVPIRGMDAEMDKLFGIFVENDLIDAGILTWMINRYVYHIKKSNQEGALKDSLEHLYFDFTKGMFSKYLENVECLGKEDEELKNIILRLSEEASRKYVGQDRDLISVLEDHDAHRPYPYGDKYMLNKIRALWNDMRNDSMIENCIKALEVYDKVVAIAGMGHIDTLRDELTKKLETFGNVAVDRFIDDINQSN